jgi:type II secretory pathway pseudopilin PulG
MKQIIRLVMVAVVLALAAPLLTQAQTAAAGECTDEAKSAMYTEFISNRKGKTAENPNGNEDTAYAAAKKYMVTCPTDDSPQAQYMKKWIASYEVGARKAQFLSAYDKKNYPEMMTVGKQVLADDPNYVRATILLGYIGYLASLGNNTSLNNESVTYAKQAIALLESGKTPDDWRPFVNKEDALARLNVSLGFIQKASAPNDAIPYFIKAAGLESPLKKNPGVYYFIAESYEAIYAKEEAAYKEKYLGKAETTESKLAQENINQLIDRVIDAYARAVATSTGTDDTTKAKKKEWMDRLTELYKYRNKSETGVTELVAGIMAKPLPDLPKPITTLPTPPATGTATPSSAPAAPATGSTTTAPPAKAGAGSTPPVAPAAAKPTPTHAQAAKPKPKANHARRP